MFLSILLLIIGFVILSYGAIFLVDGSASIAKKLKVSQIAIGLTIVAFGTSAPELIVNIISSFQGHDEIGFGNIIGSNIFNILVVLGVSGVISPISVSKNTVWRQMPFLLVGTILVFGFVNNFGSKGEFLSRLDGILLISILVIFYVFVLKDSMKDQLDVDIHLFSTVKSIVFILLGMVGLYFGAKLVVNNAVKIAHLLNVSDKFIGLTMVALGTSLPELVTSIVAMIRKHTDLAIGNVVGSNLFNLFLVLGVSSIIAPMRYNVNLNADFIFLLIITIFLFITMFTGKKNKLDRWEAIVFLVLYTAYIIFLSLRK